MKFVTTFGIYLGVLIIIPLLVSSSILLYLDMSETIQNITTTLSSIAKIEQKRLTSELNLIKIFTLNIKNDVVVHDKLELNIKSQNPENLKALNAELYNHSDDVVRKINLVNKSGIIIASSDKNSINQIADDYNQDQFEKSFLKEHLDFFFVKKVPFIHVNLPTNVGGEDFLLQFQVSLPGFFLDGDYQGLGDTGEYMVGLNDNGNIRFINNVKYANDLNALETITFDRTDIPIVHALNGEETFSSEFVDYRGVPVYSYTIFDEESNLGIVVKIDKSEVDEHLERVVKTTVIVLLIIISITVLILLNLSKQLSLHFLKIRNSLEKLKDFRVAIPPKLEKNEFDEIYLSIYHLAKHLEDFRSLKEVDAQKDEFTAMASHELKTPLVPINGYLEMLLEPNLVGTITEKQREMLNKILENTKLLDKLIIKILTAQRFGLGKVNWNIVEFDVSDLMYDVYSDNSFLMNEKKIRFKNLIKNPILIKSDFVRIKQLFSNLIQNSVDFVLDKGKIEIDAKTESDFVLFSVKDDGIGMSSKEQEGLFKKFYQVDTSITRKHGGTGLGLSICKEIAEGLGGKIWAESEKGKGCTFYFMIPKSDHTKNKK